MAVSHSKNLKYEHLLYRRSYLDSHSPIMNQILAMKLLPLYVKLKKIKNLKTLSINLSSELLWNI